MQGDQDVAPDRLQSIVRWVDWLKDSGSSEAQVQLACRNLKSCGSQKANHTREATMAARLGVVPAIIRALQKQHEASSNTLAHLLSALFDVMTGNATVLGIVEDHVAELVPLLKEYLVTLKQNTFALDALCLVIYETASMRSVAPQLCEVIPTLMWMMQRSRATDREFNLATGVISQLARTAAAFKDKRFLKNIDSNLDPAFLTELAISDAPGVRKGEAEIILLIMFADREEHPSTRTLLEHDVVRQFVMPFLECAYARKRWPERQMYFHPEQFFLIRFTSKPYAFAWRLAELGVVDLCVKFVQQQETADDVNILELIWSGKASALVGLINLMAHAELRYSVAEAASALALEDLALHEHVDLRAAAVQLAFELRRGALEGEERR